MKYKKRMFQENIKDTLMELQECFENAERWVQDTSSLLNVCKYDSRMFQECFKDTSRVIKNGLEKLCGCPPYATVLSVF